MIPLHLLPWTPRLHYLKQMRQTIIFSTNYLSQTHRALDFSTLGAHQLRSSSSTRRQISRTQPLQTFVSTRRLRSITHPRQLNLVRLSTTSTSTPSNSSPTLPVYTPPTTGLLPLLPKSWISYAELIRLDKPTGTYYLFFPCLFSTLLASIHSLSPLTTTLPIPPSTILTTTLLFFSGSIIMRGAGCAINDLWDRNLDPFVSRTRLRPIARGAISPQSALIFITSQLLLGLVILLQFPPPCLFYATPSLILVTLYPLAKRFTNYPQAVLGLTFNWGCFLGYPALNLPLYESSTALLSSSLLYLSCISWTLIYDTIYAHQDLADDLAVGIKSTALTFFGNTKTILSLIATAQVGTLAAAGYLVGAGPIYYLFSCGSVAASLGVMIWKVNLKNVGSCWWWFRNGAWITGGGIAMGMGLEYFVGNTWRDREREGKVKVMGE